MPKKKVSAQRAEEMTVARDFTLARMAACRGALAIATGALDECMGLFLDPTEDPKGHDRTELLHTIDEHVGLAATAIQAAQVGCADIDPKEAEPEADDAGDDDRADDLEDEDVDPEDDDEDGDEGEEDDDED